MDAVTAIRRVLEAAVDHERNMKLILWATPIDGWEYGIQTGWDGDHIYRRNVKTKVVQFSKVKDSDRDEDGWIHTNGPKYKWKNI